jgi:hypothetical protein
MVENPNPAESPNVTTRKETAMVYEVHATNLGGDESRFEFKRDEPLKPGDLIGAGAMSYTVVRILPDESDQYDAIVEAEWQAGPPADIRYTA